LTVPVSILLFPKQWVKKAEALGAHENQGRVIGPTGVPLIGRNYERPIHSPLEILPGLYKAKVIKGQPNPDKVGGLFESVLNNGGHNAYKPCGPTGFFVVTDSFWRH
jgi:hypothetical protein